MMYDASTTRDLWPVAPLMCMHTGSLRKERSFGSTTPSIYVVTSGCYCFQGWHLSNLNINTAVVVVNAGESPLVQSTLAELILI